MPPVAGEAAIGGALPDINLGRLLYTLFIETRHGRSVIKS